MTSLGFENYAEALKIYLSKYREVATPFPLLERSSAGLSCSAMANFCFWYAGY
jgi:hypothetical protein